MALSLLVACAASSAFAADTLTVEPGMDRVGADYQNIALDTPDPQLCRTACAADAQCKAYTYVKPGVQGPQAQCYLKSAAAAASPSDCCTSGVRTVALAVLPKATTTVPTVPVALPGIDPNADVKKQLIAQAKLIAAQQALLAKQQDTLVELSSLVAAARNELQALGATVTANQLAFAKHKHALAHVRTLDGLKLTCTAAAMAGKEAAMTKCAEAQNDGHALHYNGYYADAPETEVPYQ